MDIQDDKFLTSLMLTIAVILILIVSALSGSIIFGFFLFGLVFLVMPAKLLASRLFEFVFKRSMDDVSFFSGRYRFALPFGKAVGGIFLIVYGALAILYFLILSLAIDLFHYLILYLFGKS